MKDVIDFSAKRIREYAAQGELAAYEQMGRIAFYGTIWDAAHNSDHPQEIRDYAKKQLAILPPL